MMCAFFILLVFVSQNTPLHCSASNGQLETCRLLVESKANVDAQNWFRTSLRFPYLLLTICVAVRAKLPSNVPSTATEPTWWPIYAASQRSPARRSRSPLAGLSTPTLPPANPSTRMQQRARASGSAPRLQRPQKTKHQLRS
jgi:hypothetical protein